MGKLSTRDLSRILASIREIYAVVEPEDFPPRVLAILADLVKAKSVAITEVDRVEGKSAVYHHPPDSSGWDRIEQAFQRNIAQHPVVAAVEKTRDGSAKAISDFLSDRLFKATTLYQEVFEPMGVTDQLSIAMVGGAGLVIGISFNRTRRGFSSRDRTVLNMLRPHVLQAYLNCRERGERRNRNADRHSLVVNQLPLGLICVETNGRIAWLTDAAKHLLHGHFPNAAESIHGLPDELRRWLKRLSTARQRGRATQSQQLVSYHGNGELRIRHCPLEDGRDVLLLQELVIQSKSRAFAEYSFTNRERQVAQQIITGEAAPAVARSLDMSPRTLQKHLERIYRKLRVNNLAAACIMLLRSN